MTGCCPNANFWAAPLSGSDTSGQAEFDMRLSGRSIAAEVETPACRSSGENVAASSDKPMPPLYQIS